MNERIRHPHFTTGKGIAVLLCLLAGWLHATAQNADACPVKLRIASYNIHHGEGMDGKLDFVRIGSLLGKLNADVIAIQEIDSAATRTNGSYGLGEMADQTGYHPTYGPSIDFQGGKYGVGILSRERPLKTWRIPLPGKSEPRTLLMAEFDKYVFACTHLSLDEDERLASVPLIEHEAASCAKPFIVAGDWNDNSGSRLLKAMEKSFTICNRPDSATFPSDKPEECIDFIAVYKGTQNKGCCNGEHGGRTAKVEESMVVDERTASDHRPVFVSVALP